MIKFTIKGTLPGLNDYIAAERTNRYAGAAMKKQTEAIVMHCARSLGKTRFDKPVRMGLNRTVAEIRTTFRRLGAR